jgi:Putative auto-transporter adhesin, head GIN domain
MRTIAILTGGALCCIFASCDVVGIRGNGHVVTEQRNVTDFSEIDGSGALQIEWREGPPALSITTDENLIRYIDTYVAENRLRLHTRERIRPTHHTKVVVTSPHRIGVRQSGACDLTAHGLAGSKFMLQSSGAADVILDGAVDELLADMTGASDLRAKSLNVKSAEISITGAASAYITVSDALRVSITGAGDVTYYGPSPKTIEKHITGAGSIHHKD